MVQPFPLPRETRESAELVTDGSALYGPFAFRIFDLADVSVWLRPAAGEPWAPAPFVTVEKVSGLAFDDFRVCFSPAPVPGQRLLVQGRRLHERLVEVTRGGALSSERLEAELSRQGAILQELRRDQNSLEARAWSIPRGDDPTGQELPPLSRRATGGVLGFTPGEGRPTVRPYWLGTVLTGPDGCPLGGPDGELMWIGDPLLAGIPDHLAADPPANLPATPAGVAAALQARRVAIWDSLTTASMQELGRRVCHLADFHSWGLDATGEHVSTGALRRWLEQAMAAETIAQMPAGRFVHTSDAGELPVLEGVDVRGVGNGWWRASPFTVRPVEFAAVGVSEILLAGTGARVHTQDFITESRQCGYHRHNPDRHYNNAFDDVFAPLDLTNRDAVGATPATLRAFSAGLVIGDPDRAIRPVRLRDFRVAVSCPDPDSGDGAFGTGGYGVMTAMRPFADWDIGLWIRDQNMFAAENVNVVGYFRDRGVLMQSMIPGDEGRGQGEMMIWTGGFIQSGLAIRSGDSWPVIAKGADFIDIRWTPSHTFPSSGSLMTNNIGSLTYDSLTYIHSPPLILRFGGIADTSEVDVPGTSISTSKSTGVSHTRFRDCYLADQGHATRIEPPNPAFGDQMSRHRAAIEISGDPTRAVKFENCVPVCCGPMAMLFGWAKNIELWSTYTEPKSYRLTPGGASQTQGALIIAGPVSTIRAEVGEDNLPSIESYGANFTGPCNRMPLIRGPSSARLSEMTDVFNPRYYFDTRLMFNSGEGTLPGIGDNDSIIQGFNGEDIALYRRGPDGTTHRVIHGYASGNIGIGDALVLYASGAVGLDAEFRPRAVRFDDGIGPTLTGGTGSPEGVVTASTGSEYLRADGPPWKYRKTTGSGDTGWEALA